MEEKTKVENLEKIKKKNFLLVGSNFKYSIEKSYLRAFKKLGIKNIILDKNFLINKINSLNGRTIDNKLINFTLIENDNEISVFFDNKTFDLIGWQNIDLYQNFNITFLSPISKNRILPKNLFKLPVQN